MIRKEDIGQLIRKYPGGEDFFIVDIHVSPSNKITVIADRTKGISIDECARISKFIEQNLDREKEDYELVVSSPGLDSPFTVIEQYRKNIGENIKIQLANGETHKGKLYGIKKDNILLEEAEKVPKHKPRHAGNKKNIIT